MDIHRLKWEKGDFGPRFLPFGAQIVTWNASSELFFSKIYRSIRLPVSFHSVQRALKFHQLLLPVVYLTKWPGPQNEVSVKWKWSPRSPGHAAVAPISNLPWLPQQTEKETIRSIWDRHWTHFFMRHAQDSQATIWWHGLNSVDAFLYEHTIHSSIWNHNRIANYIATFWRADRSHCRRWAGRRGVFPIDIMIGSKMEWTASTAFNGCGVPKL